MKKLWLLAVPVAMSLVLAGCEKDKSFSEGLRAPVQQYDLVNGKLIPKTPGNPPIQEYQAKAPNGKIYDTREWVSIVPSYKKDLPGRCYLQKNAAYLASIGKPVPKEEVDYMYDPVPGGCRIPTSDTPVFRSQAEASKARN